jgi:hypothetical protein
MYEKIEIYLYEGTGKKSRKIEILKEGNSVAYREFQNEEQIGGWQESSIAQWRLLEGTIKVLTETKHDTWTTKIGDIILKLSKVDNAFVCTYKNGDLLSLWDVSIEHHTITRLI